MPPTCYTATRKNLSETGSFSTARAPEPRGLAMRQTRLSFGQKSEALRAKHDKVTGKQSLHFFTDKEGSAEEKAKRSAASKTQIYLDRETNTFWFRRYIASEIGPDHWAVSLGTRSKDQQKVED